MQEKNMRYGRFLRSKRISDSRELTIKDIAVELGISASLVCDVEQGRRKPFDEAKTQNSNYDPGEDEGRRSGKIGRSSKAPGGGLLPCVHGDG